MHEFIDNLCYTNHTYDRGLLKTLYTKIKSQPFKSAPSDAAATADERPKRRVSTAIASAATFGRQLTDQVDYNRGWIMVKTVYDSDGKRSRQ